MRHDLSRISTLMHTVRSHMLGEIIALVTEIQMHVFEKMSTNSSLRLKKKKKNVGKPHKLKPTCKKERKLSKYRSEWQKDHELISLGSGNECREYFCLPFSTGPPHPSRGCRVVVSILNMTDTTVLGLYRFLTSFTFMPRVAEDFEIGA